MTDVKVRSLCDLFAQLIEQLTASIRRLDRERDHIVELRAELLAAPQPDLDRIQQLNARLEVIDTEREAAGQDIRQLEDEASFAGCR